MSDTPDTSSINIMPIPAESMETTLNEVNLKDTHYKFDPCLSEEERSFYEKAYPTVDIIRDRKVHCTVCKSHIGTAPIQENSIKMHPILRVTHCLKCHDFYNSGEFSKGEDGSELYCRWCGQGGEVYCCSNCPYVFCKSCIVKNLSRGVIADIEQNENWHCFNCSPKILWPLRAQHWALMQYIEQQKKQIFSLNLPEIEFKQQMELDRSKCCRLAKAKCGNMSDSLESLDSITSRRSYTTGKKKPSGSNDLLISPAAKRLRNNDEVVCTPDLMSMLEPDCQITLSQQKISQRTLPSANSSLHKIISHKPGFGNSSHSIGNNISGHAKSSVPPPLVLRNTPIKIRPGIATPIVRRAIVGPRTSTHSGTRAPVYHTINGYRIDLNSAAQQSTFRLPNGKLIQVKRKGTLPVSPSNQVNNSNWQLQQRPLNQSMNSMRQVHITQHSYQSVNGQQQQQTQRFHNSTATNVASTNHNGVSHVQVINGRLVSTGNGGQSVGHGQTANGSNNTLKSVLLRHTFPDTPIGQARSKLQDQVFNAMEICVHLTNKIQKLTNANAYKQARSYLEIKELYIHLSYLLTYAIGRFKGLQDKCLADMRQLGFTHDANCLENGQLAADKQASDDEDNAIEIVEPKVDLITLDSDDDDATNTSNLRAKSNNNNNYNFDNTSKDNSDLFTIIQNFSATTLKVDATEGAMQFSPNSTDASSTTTNVQIQQPRIKTTNKPNPTLIKQNRLMEVERLEDMKRNDSKLKMNCMVKLRKVEEENNFSRKKLLNIQNQLKIGLDVSTEGELSKTETECSVNANLMKTESINSGTDSEKNSLQLRTVLDGVVVGDDLTKECRKSPKINDHSFKINHGDNDNSKLKLLHEQKSISTIQKENFGYRHKKEIEELLNFDLLEDDTEDIDVDEEIDKFLRNCNLKMITTSTKQPLNLKDTMDRTIEKLIANGNEKVSDTNANEFPVKEILQAKTEKTLDK